MLLELPRTLQQGGRAALPGAGVVLSEGSAGSPGERGQSDVAAGLRSLVLFISGESEVSLLFLSD